MQASKAVYPEITPYSGVSLYPLSFQQERVLYLNKLSGDGPLWNRISCKKLLGQLDARALEEVVAALAARHPALRTRIVLVDGAPQQRRGEALLGAFELVDLSGLPAADREDGARALLNREYAEPMILEGGPLFRAVLARVGQAEHWLILKLHHIISDATTLRILWNDLKALYNARGDGADRLPALEVDCFDYAKWVRETLAEAKTAEQEAYWLGRFAGELPQLDLPVDSLPPAKMVTFSGALERQALPPQLVRRLQSFSFDRRVVPFATLLGAYYLLLHHYCRQDDIVIGTVFAGRHYSGKLNQVAGFFSNTAALRAELDPARTVDELVKAVHALVTDAYRMQDYPFQRLVEKLNPGREHRRNPLFRAMFNVVTEPEDRRAFDGVHAEEWREPDISATQVDLFLDLHLARDSSEARIEYNADIFRPETIRRMLRHYVTLLGRMLEAPQARAIDLGMLDADEEKQVLSFGEGPAELWPAGGIIELLENRAARAPDEPALLAGDETLTCGTVNRRANQLAATLAAGGVRAGDVVAIMLDRSPEMVIGILAILKAGAAYLPIDPSFPRQRIEYILRDSGSTCLLLAGDAARASAPRDVSRSLRILSIDGEAAYTGDGPNPGGGTDPGGAAYVIYTSGSTGRPKGVVVEHGALMNTLRFLEARYPLRGKTILFKTNFTFDVSAAELFGWVFDGGRLALLDPGGEKDPTKLLHAIAKFGVTHVNFVPSMLDALLAGLREEDAPALERLRHVFVAGEALKPDVVQRLHGKLRGVSLEDIYGPTEAAVYATWYPVPRGQELERVPIGKPLSNTRAYILDDDLRLAPIGLTGELCLSGAGLARGYLHAPELTAEKFCPDPYRPGERLYRTGDLARWDDEGLIQFLGRSDGQVKIRGFRVEVGEVERKLQGCRGVAEAAVTARTDQFGQKVLVGYLVRQVGSDRRLDDVREEMASWLPGYMLPEHLVELDALPRLASGKVDLKALPDPRPRSVSAPSAPPCAPADPVEERIVAIAEKLLNTTGLDPTSNFFNLGGNSLLTLRFIAALDDAFGTRLPVMEFLSLPSLAEIAELVDASRAPTHRAPPPPPCEA